jgi:hypothetical protein
MGKRRFSMLRPRLPRISGIGSTTTSSIGWARRAFGRSGAECPIEGCKGTLIIDEEHVDGDLEVKRFLTCPECGTREPIDNLLDVAASKIDHLRSGEKIFFGWGCAVFAVFAIISFFNGDIMTFLGGGVFALILIMRAFAFRYRAWQACNRKLFLDKPPIREWIMDELKK